MTTIRVASSPDIVLVTIGTAVHCISPQAARQLARMLVETLEDGGAQEWREGDAVREIGGFWAR